jgi:tRNA threonylcarbamoyladenosine biosynthesis protein TsaB
MSERLVLALDGSTRVCSAALLSLDRWETAGSRETRWKVAARREEADGRGQAKVLLRLVDEMLEEVGGSPDDLGAVVAGTGPGTFTGVRITVATARALGLALSVPVLGVSTLSALAAGVAATPAGGAPRRALPAGAPAPDLLVPAVDARRGQLFFAIYANRRRAGGECAGGWVRIKDFGVCDRRAFGETLAAEGARSVVVVGGDRGLVGEVPSGVEFVSAEVAAERLLMGQECLEEPGDLPQGSRLTPWLGARLERASTPPRAATPAPVVPGSPGTPESVTPIYVRPPDADIHITKMKDPWGDGLDKR